MAVATRGHGGIRRLAFGSTADKLVRAAEVPVLVIRPTKPSRRVSAKPGTKRTLVVDRHGIPLAAYLSAANVSDSRLLAPVLDALLPIRRPRGRPRRRTVIVDPPWYPRQLLEWSKVAARTVGIWGVIFVSIWPGDARPTARMELDAAIDDFGMCGRRWRGASTSYDIRRPTSRWWPETTREDPICPDRHVRCSCTLTKCLLRPSHGGRVRRRWAPPP